MTHHCPSIVLQSPRTQIVFPSELNHYSISLRIAPPKYVPQNYTPIVCPSELHRYSISLRIAPPKYDPINHISFLARGPDIILITFEEKWFHSMLAPTRWNCVWPWMTFALLMMFLVNSMSKILFPQMYCPLVTRQVSQLLIQELKTEIFQKCWHILLLIDVMSTFHLLHHHRQDGRVVITK